MLPSSPRTKRRRNVVFDCAASAGMQVVENSLFIVVTFQARPCLNDTVFGLIR